MNILNLIAGILALMASIGHFTMGSKQFLRPILESDTDEVPKKVMHSLFHYMSVFMVFTSLVLIICAFGACNLFENCADVTKFIGITYLGMGIVQLIIAATSRIEKGIFKLFQWVFWILIGISALAGSF